MKANSVRIFRGRRQMHTGNHTCYEENFSVIIWEPELQTRGNTRYSSWFDMREIESNPTILD